MASCSELNSVNSKALAAHCQYKSKVKPDPRNVWERIKEALKLETAPQIAKALGLTKQSVYDWQKKLPGLDNLIAISESGNASLHWLITGEGPKSFERTALIEFLFSGQVKDYVLSRAVESNDGIRDLLETLALESAAYRKIHNEGNSSNKGKQAKDNDREAIQSELQEMVQQEVNKSFNRLIIEIKPVIDFIQEVGRAGRLKTSDVIKGFEEFDHNLIIGSNVNPNDFILPEGVGLLFKDWDKLSDEDKLETLKQIKELVEDKKTSKRGSYKKKR